MATEGQTTQWPQKDRQHNCHRRTDTTMTTEGQTTQWPQKDRQHNCHRRTDGHCVVCPSVAIVLSVLLWSLWCLSFCGNCVVCSSVAIVLSVLLWPLCCLSFCGLNEPSLIKTPPWLVTEISRASCSSYIGQDHCTMYLLEYNYSSKK
jgi:hypothetical protein